MLPVAVGTNAECQVGFEVDGTGGRTRTGTLSLAGDFEFAV